MNQTQKPDFSFKTAQFINLRCVFTLHWQNLEISVAIKSSHRCCRRGKHRISFIRRKKGCVQTIEHVLSVFLMFSSLLLDEQNLCIMATVWNLLRKTGGLHYKTLLIPFYGRISFYLRIRDQYCNDKVFLNQRRNSWGKNCSLKFYKNNSFSIKEEFVKFYSISPRLHSPHYRKKP